MIRIIVIFAILTVTASVALAREAPRREQRIALPEVAATPKAGMLAEIESIEPE